MLIKNVSDRELDECIDAVLELFKGHMIVTNKVFMTALEQGKIDQDQWKLYEYRVIRKMVDFNLITESDPEFGAEIIYELTPFGRDVLKYESWSKFRELRHQKEIDDAKVIHNAANQIFINNYSGIAAIIISLGSLAVSVSQCSQYNQVGQESENGKQETAIPYSDKSNQKMNDSTENGRANRSVGREKADSALSNP